MKFLRKLFTDETMTPVHRLIYLFDAGGSGRSEAPRGDEGTEKKEADTDAIEQETREDLSKLKEEVEGKAKERFLEDIAAEHGMSFQQLVDFNAENGSKLHLVEAKKFGDKISAKNRDKHWCWGTDTLYVPVKQQTKATPGVPAREEVIAVRYEERAQQQRQEATERRAHTESVQASQNESYLARHRELIGKNVPLPDFLRGGQNRTDNTQWAEMLRLSHQTDNPKVGRLVDVISEKPLSLTPPTFREMVRRGAPNQLSFEDITQTITGESAQKFTEKYEGLLEKRKKGDAKDPARLEKAIQNREAVIVQAHKIFQALEELKGGRLLHEEREAEQLAAREEVSQVERVATSDLFDLDAALEGRLERMVRGEQKEYIGLNPQLVQGMKNHLEALGVDPKLAQKADLGFTLQLLLACYGVEELINNGSISQKIKDGGETILHLNAIPGDFNASNPLAVAMAKSIKARGGALAFDRVDAENMKLSYLEGEARAAAVLESTFRNQRDSITWEDAETGGKVDYESLRYATREMDTEAMLADLTTYRTHFDSQTGAEVVDYQLLGEDMAYFLEQGIKGWANDPDVDIFREMDRAKVPGILPADKREVRRLDEALRDLGENQNRINKQLQDAKRLLAKEPGSERKARVDRLQIEFDKEQAQIDDLIAKKQFILEKGQYVESLTNILAIDPQNLSALTSQQKMFLQNGYRLNKGRRIEERVRLEMAENLDQVIEFYANNPTMQGIMLAVMGQLKEQGHEVTPQLLETTATAIEHALKTDGFKFELPKFPETTEGGPMGAIAGSTESHGSEITRGQVGAALSIPVKINDKETINITLTAGIGHNTNGGTQAGLGMGMGKSWKLDEEVTLGVHVGAGATQEGVGIGTSAVIAGEIGDFTTFQVLSAGLGIDTKQAFTPGVSYTLGFKRRAESYAENARSVAEFTAGLGHIESTRSYSKKVEAIAELPETQALVSLLETAGYGPKTKASILMAAYEVIKQTTGDEAEANMGVSPISGASITLIPVPPFIIPGLSFQFRGKTITVFAVPNMNEVLEKSGKTIEQALRDKVADAHVVEGIDKNDWEIDPAPAGYNMEGERVKLEGRSTHQFTVRDLLSRNLSAQNAAIHESGFHLEPGSGDTEGMLNLQVNGAHGNVEIYMDPAMKARLTAKPGENGQATSQDIYMALNQLNPNSDLYITRETFVLPRKRNGSYLYTRITIKGDSERSIRDIRSERHGLITFRNNSNAETIAPRGEGEALTNVLNWSDMDEATERAEVFEALGMDRYLAELGRVAELSPRAIDAGPDAIDPDGKLTQLAKDIFQKDKQTWLSESVFNENWFESRKDLVEKLQTAARGLTPAIELNQNQLNFMISVIRKETYIKGNRETQAERDAYRTRNHRFFEKVLSEKFSPEVATQILRDVEGNETRRAVGPTTEVFTVVGREGVSGLRADTLPAGAEVVGYTDYSQDLEMRQAILDQLGALPSNPEAFLRSTLALNVYEAYSLIQGIEDTNLMTEIYNNPALLAVPGSEHARAFSEFQAIVQKLQANQASGAMVEITTDFGVTLELGIKTEVFGGTLEYCDNPTIGLNQNLVLGGLQGMTASELQTFMPKIKGKVSTPIYELFTAYTHKHTPEEHTRRTREPAPSGGGEGDEKQGGKKGGIPNENTDDTSAPDTGGTDLDNL